MKIVERIVDGRVVDEKRAILTVILAIFLVVTAFPATVFALTTTAMNAGQLSGTNEFNIPIMNDADAKNITFSITPRSRYLENYVSIEPLHLSLQPYETKYVKVKINVTPSLAPGVHELILMPNIHVTQASGVKVVSTSTITIRFSKPGTVTKNVVLNSLDVYKNGKIEFRLYAENKGNVRVTAMPFVEIRKYGNHLTMLKGSTQHLLEPSQLMQMDINYNPSPGTYQAIAYVKFDGIDSNTITRYFTVGDANQTSDGLGGTTGFVSSDGETFYWYDENATIDIGVEQEKDGKDGKTIGKIKIIDFNAIVGDKLSIKLKMENTTEPFVYDVIFSLIDENGIVIKSAEDTGRLEGIIEISKEMNLDDIKPGNYTLKLEITYRQNGMKTIEKSLQINIPEKRDSITGLVISEQGYGLYIILAIIAIVAVFLAKFKFMKKHESRINYHKPYINYNKPPNRYDYRQYRQRYVKIRDDERK